MSKPQLSSKVCRPAILLLWAVSAAQGVTVYVDDDAIPSGDGAAWSAAFRDLQDALAQASTNGAITEIRVAAGVYVPDQGTYSRNATFQLLNGVSLIGGYAGLGAPDPDDRDFTVHESILSGDLFGDDQPGFVNNTENSIHVVTGTGTDATAVLDGFVVTGGNATNNGGGGMIILSASPTLSNCTFRMNSAAAGGGVLADHSGSAITNCIFQGNKAGQTGGGLLLQTTSVLLSDCIFSENRADLDGGGVMSSQPGDVMFRDCTFTGNWSSTGRGGGMYSWRGNRIFVSCVFNGNTSFSHGGGLHQYLEVSDNATLINCTFAGNAAWVGQGGGV